MFSKKNIKKYEHSHSHHFSRPIIHLVTNAIERSKNALQILALYLSAVASIVQRTMNRIWLRIDPVNPLQGVVECEAVGPTAPFDLIHHDDNLAVFPRHTRRLNSGVVFLKISRSLDVLFEKFSCYVLNKKFPINAILGDPKQDEYGNWQQDPISARQMTRVVTQ